MTGKERIQAVFDRKIPDHVPTFEWDIYKGVMKSISDTTDACEFVLINDIDGIAIWQDRRIKRIDDRSFIDEFRVIRAYSDEYPSALAYPVNSASDLASYKMPDADDQAIYATLQHAIDILGKEKAVIGRVRDVFSLPRDLLGFENCLMDFIIEPDLVSEIMEMSIEYSLKVAKNMKSMGIGIIGCLDDIADSKGLFMGPELYKKQVLPYFKKFITGCHLLGLKVIKHSDGNLNPILDDLINSGIDGLDPIDPMGMMDIKSIKHKYGNNLVLKGNIDCVWTLVSGTKEQVEKDIIKCLNEGMPEGSFIISSSNSIHKSVNPENYAHMLHCIKKYGAYNNRED
ncbi:MAG TPA: uroporphyrinogen decarboxylase family protein [Clostridia bacterium]|jgi:uroporphyrinogen decarboxylase|nr:uroporphyrinogen decarboxylase family protein [Clostridia bacterium]